METDGLDAGQMARITDALRSLPGVKAVIPGHSSWLVLAERADHLPLMTERIGMMEIAPGAEGADVRSLEIPVSLGDADAPDLPILLALLGITREPFAAALERLELRARFPGFRPGFVYLEGIPDEWRLPRRPTSRSRIPGGSFAIAGDMAAFYPSDSPGGWNVIGRTDTVLWNPASEPPALIRAGDRVRIRTVPRVADSLAVAIEDPVITGETFARVVDPGQRTYVVGPADHRRIEDGLPPGGPFDDAAASVANRAVGNPAGSALLECALVGPVLLFMSTAIVAWSGAPAPSMRINGRPVGDVRQLHLERDDELDVGPLDGMRGYLAVAGGIVNPAGPRDLAPWAVGVGPLYREPREGGGNARIARVDRADRLVLRARAGPHRVDDQVIASIMRDAWSVSNLADRVAVRLSPRRFQGADGREVRSCGMQPGSVQFHPNGDLVIMGPDHPVTGGYLQPMTVYSSDLWKIAQLRPGDSVRWLVE